MNAVRRYLPWIALAAVWILWGSTFLAIRVAVETIPPLLMAGARYVTAGVLLGALTWALSPRKPAWPSRRELGQIAVTGFLLLVIGNALLCLAETRVPSGTSALLVASVPIWILLIEAARARATIRWSSVAGVAIGSTGMVLLIREQWGLGSALYAGLVLVGSMGWAAGSIYARQTGQRHPLTAPLEMIAGGIGSIAIGLIAGEASSLSVAHVSAPSLYAMLWLITGGAMAGYTAYAYAVRTLPPTTVSTYAYVNPVIAVILGALVLHESITWYVAAGGVTVVASVVVILVGNRSSAPEGEP